MNKISPGTFTSLMKLKQLSLRITWRNCGGSGGSLNSSGAVSPWERDHQCRKICVQWIKPDDGLRAGNQPTEELRNWKQSLLGHEDTLLHPHYWHQYNLHPSRSTTFPWVCAYCAIQLRNHIQVVPKKDLIFYNLAKIPLMSLLEFKKIKKKMKARYWQLNCKVDVFSTWLIMYKAKYTV